MSHFLKSELSSTSSSLSKSAFSINLRLDFSFRGCKFKLLVSKFLFFVSIFLPPVRKILANNILVQWPPVALFDKLKFFIRVRVLRWN